MVPTLWSVCRVGLSVVAISPVFMGLLSQPGCAAPVVVSASQPTAMGIPEWMSGSAAIVGGALISSCCSRRRPRRLRLGAKSAC
jgi:hypothetical protein